MDVIAGDGASGDATAAAAAAPGLATASSCIGGMPRRATLDSVLKPLSSVIMSLAVSVSSQPVPGKGAYLSRRKCSLA